MFGTSSRLSAVLTLSPVVAVVALSGCAEPTADRCIDQRFDAQPTQRFVVGETFYLPTVDGDDGLCAELRWTVVDRPEGSTDPIVRGADGIWRITPTVPGQFRFALAEVDDADAEAIELEVVPADSRPFYNLNYYGSRAITEVDGELWVANVQSPTVTRLSPQLETLATIDVGPWPVAIAWREGMAFAVVAQRGNDTLGLIDVASGRLVDAVWVGDEPANVVLSPDGATAYVALAGEGAVAIVDLGARVRTARVELGIGPLGLAVSSDGATLFAAGHRTGHPDRFPFEPDPVEDERDLAVIDTASGEIQDWWLDIGTTITSLLYREDGAAGPELFVARLRNDTQANLGSVDEPNFLHEVAVFDPATGDELRSADLGRQASASGYAVSLHGLSLAAGRLWVAAESSDQTLALDPDTLAELGRVETLGRPRSVVATESGAFVHGSQSAQVTSVRDDFTVATTATTAADPRDAQATEGQYYFTGAGRDYAQNWTCNSCHADGLSDTLVWNAGPFAGRKVSRPFFWLEGTYPLGWDGYLSSIDNYAFTVNTNVGVRPTTDEHRALSSYLASIMPPPAANGFTARDGALSALGQRGKQVFENEAGCASCHPLPLTTNRAVLGAGITEGVTDVPGLIGSYRLGVWLKRGDATTLHAAVDSVFASLGDPDLSTDDRAALDRYLLELTARDFLVLTTTPQAGSATHGVDQPIELVFSHPVWSDPSNLAGVRLLDAAGAEVAVERALAADGRHLTLTPTAALDFDADYQLAIDPAFESFGEQTLWSSEDDGEGWRADLRTAAAPILRLAGDYVWTIDMPTADLEALRFDLEQTIPTAVPLTVVETAAGGEVVFDYGLDLILERSVVVDGGTLVTPALPIPIGPSFADSTGIQATLVDVDDDGIGDEAEGTLTISGPGFQESGIVWRLARPSAGGECETGSEGALPVEVSFDGATPIVDWGSVEPDALGVYFLDPDAQPPAGPGQPVTGGDALWVVQLSDFPNGFAGPVTYGVVPDGAQDDTAAVGGGDGPAELQAGQCVKAAVTTTGFEQGSVIFVVP